MQIDSKSPCGICEKLNKCKTENKNRVRECSAYKPSEFYEMLGMSIEEKVNSFGETIKFLNKIQGKFCNECGVKMVESQESEKDKDEKDMFIFNESDKRY